MKLFIIVTLTYFLAAILTSNSAFALTCKQKNLASGQGYEFSAANRVGTLENKNKVLARDLYKRNLSAMRPRCCDRSKTDRYIGSEYRVAVKISGKSGHAESAAVFKDGERIVELKDCRN